LISIDGSFVGANASIKNEPDQGKSKKRKQISSDSEEDEPPKKKKTKKGKK
jgi:hypothetical protein